MLKLEADAATDLQDMFRFQIEDSPHRAGQPLPHLTLGNRLPCVAAVPADETWFDNFARSIGLVVNRLPFIHDAQAQIVRGRGGVRDTIADDISDEPPLSRNIL